MTLLSSSIFGGTLPEWLGLLAALAGLFVGGAAGGRFGAVARSRHEDRMSILADIDLLAKARDNFEDPYWETSVFVWHKFGPWVHLARVAMLEDSISRSVGRLPWHDRAAWKSVISSHGTQLHLALFKVMAWYASYPGRNSTATERRHLVSVKILPPDADEHSKYPPEIKDDEWFGWDSALERFEQQILDQVNPSATGKFRWRYKRFKMLLVGPRPWEVPVRVFPRAAQRKLSATRDRVGSGPLPP